MSEYNEIPKPDIYTPEAVLDHLLCNPNGTTNEWITHPTWTANQIQRLVMGRVEEVAFSEKDGLLYVSEMIGDPLKRAQSNNQNLGLSSRLREGKIVGHIHPALSHGFNTTQTRKDYPYGCRLSWSDIWNISYFPNSNASYILFHQLGGTQYVAPKKEQLTPSEILGLFSSK